MRQTPSKLWVPEAPHLMLNRTLEGEVGLKVGSMEGIITATRYHAPSRTVRERRVMRNLITNAGIDIILDPPTNNYALLSTNTSFGYISRYIQVGTGTSAPAVTQTTLDTPLGARINRTSAGDGTHGVLSTDPYYGWGKRVRVFLESEAVGNLTEVGWFSEATGGVMLNRQLFKDELGNPSPFTKLADEQLIVEVEFRLYPPPWASSADDTTGVVNISGVNYDYTVRPMSRANLNGWSPVSLFTDLRAGFAEPNTLEAVTANTSFAPIGTVTAQPYTAGNGYRDVLYTLEPTVGNFATGIGKILTPYHSGAAKFAIYFTTTKVPKDSTKRLKLTLRYTIARRP